jgi:BirA family biotin operon repressor/biotin-[acetyl-CoA-carboxylase] ligase
MTHHPYADWIIHLAQTSSTMSEADQLLTKVKYCPQSVLITADTQSQGIGRHANHWASPMGGLWFSYLFKSDYCSPILTLMIGLAIRKSLVLHYPQLSTALQIKWPNDLLLGNQKLCGILTKVSSGYLIFGIGINTNVDDIPPLNTPFQPVSLSRFLGFQISHPALLSSLLCSITAILAESVSGSTSGNIAQINSVLFGRGQVVVIQQGSNLISGIILEVAPDGALVLLTQDGQPVLVHTGTILKFSSASFSLTQNG